MDIFSYVERDFYALRQVFARLHFLFADTIDNRETAIDSVATAAFCKFYHAIKPCLSILRAANGLILFIAGRVEGNIDKVDFPLQIGNDIPLVDKIALTVGVQASFQPLFVEIIAKRNHFRHLIGRLAKATKYRFFKASQIAVAVCNRHYLLRRRLSVFQPKVIAKVARPLVSHAKIAGVGAFVGEVDVKISVQNVQVGILAVFLFFLVGLILAPAVFIILPLLLLLLLRGLLLLRLSVLPVIPLLIFILLLAAVLRVLLALLPFLLLRLLRLALRRLILRILRLRGGGVAVVFMTVSVPSSSAAVAAFLVAVYNGLLVFLVFFHIDLLQPEKELLCVLQNLLFQLLFIFTAKHRHVLGDILYVFGFVGKHPAIGYGSEIGTVRFR